MSNVPKIIEISGALDRELRYGENPWQTSAGLFATSSVEDPLAIVNFKSVFGVDTSFNNVADVDRLLQTVTHIAAVLERNYGRSFVVSAGAKHGNVCGVGVKESTTDSLVAMIEGDERAIFGGSIMTNFIIGQTEATILAKHNIERGKRLLDILVAPEIEDEAVPVVARKNGGLKGLVNPALSDLGVDSLDVAPRYRYVRGGFLLQDNYAFVPDLSNGQITRHGEVASDQQEIDMLVAWAIGSTSNSNTVTLVKNGQLIGNGVGQQDRVSAAELALKRARDAGHDIEGSVAYSDSFFPFPDGPQVLISQGVEAIFASSGSVNDPKVFEAIGSAGVKLYTIPDSVGRGFYAH